MISIHILQKLGASVYRPLEIIDKACLETVCFPSERKKANVIPVHKMVTNNYLTFIAQYCFCRPVKRYYKDYYIV